MIAILFDSETHDKEEPEIIEAAFARVEFGNPTRIPGRMTLLDEDREPYVHELVTTQRFQPSKPITLGAMATHGIMDEDLLGCDPSASLELPPCDFVCGHNVDFDMTAAGAMDNGAKRIDTCAMARACWPDLDCYSQSALMYHLDRANARERLKNAHGAAADVLLCKTILDACIAHAGVQSWEELWRFSEEARIPKTMYWGKHAGMAISDLPRDYVNWLLTKCNNPPIDPYLRKALTGDPKQRTMFCPQ